LFNKSRLEARMGVLVHAVSYGVFAKASDWLLPLHVAALLASLRRIDTPFGRLSFRERVYLLRFFFFRELFFPLTSSHCCLEAPGFLQQDTVPCRRHPLPLSSSRIQEELCDRTPSRCSVLLCLIFGGFFRFWSHSHFVVPIHERSREFPRSLLSATCNPS